MTTSITAGLSTAAAMARSVGVVDFAERIAFARRVLSISVIEMATPSCSISAKPANRSCAEFFFALPESRSKQDQIPQR